MNIGLLAMSGIRAHDSKLLELGLTLPGFVERSRTVASLPSLGLLFIAASTPPGHSVTYYEAESDGAEPRAVYDCDLVGISTFSAQAFEAYSVADRLRAAGVLVAIGGLHATACPEEAFEHADYVVVGEGENVWPEVVDAAARRQPRRIFDSHSFPPVDIRTLPTPRYDLLGDRPYNRFTVQTSRGCPWRCEFCASSVMLRRPYRKRPVDDVIRDIRAIQQIRRDPFIEFADDNTFVDKQWGKELCRKLEPLDIRWFAETDSSVADDDELLETMRESGCRQILIGLESPDEPALRGLELRNDFKAKRAHEYRDAIRRIQSHRITVNGCFVLGLDRHTPEIFEQVYDFAEESELFDVQITILTAFPATPLYERLLREDRVTEKGRWDLCTLFDVNYEPAGMSPQQLREGIYRLSERLYSEETTQRRRRAFFDHVIAEWHARFASDAPIAAEG